MGPFVVNDLSLTPFPIFSLRPGSSRDAIYLMPDIGGNLLYARELIFHFTPDRPIFGLRLSKEVDFSGLETTAIENLADYFARAINETKPGGPHHVLGHSFGAYLAFETARAFERLGAQPGLVALLDAGIPPSGPGLIIQTLKHMTKRIARHLHNETTETENVLAHPGFATFDLRKYPVAYRVVIASLYWAMVRYRPRAYSGSIMVFRSTANRFWAPRDLGWSRYVRGGVRTVDVDGDHLGIIRKRACAEQIARAIESVLQQKDITVEM